MESNSKQQPACCALNHDTANAKTYGLLYNWYAVNDPRKLAPKGWYIPSYNDWLNLEKHCNALYAIGQRDIDNLNGYKDGTIELILNENASSPESSSNKTGFSGLLAGYRDESGEFVYEGISTGWWSSTSAVEIGSLGVENKYENLSYCFILTSGNGKDYHNVAENTYGFYVRCINRPTTN
jgi:uncharacterized protein (TIGR02145 family)